MVVQLLGVCGSLRASSLNARLLEAAVYLAPSGVDMRLTSFVSKLPLFNPDIAVDSSDAVGQWVKEMRSTDGLVISTPEYARGYPGSLKNALDWLVSTDAFVAKPFMMLGASSRSTIGRDTLINVLETMSGVHIAQASLTLNLLGTLTESQSIIEVQEHSNRIGKSIQLFASEVRLRKVEPR